MTANLILSRASDELEISSLKKISLLLHRMNFINMHVPPTKREVTATGEWERLFGFRDREGKLKITFPFYGKGTGIRKCYGKGMGNLRLVIPGIPGII